ncbi:MAG: xylulokinase [Rhodobacteraceae bacterium]|nr:xylulokinase [Paracoccaceae bacterium]
MSEISLGIDLGTSAVKVLALCANGAVAAKASRPYPTHRPNLGWAEQSPDDWWSAVCSACQDIITQTNEPKIIAVGLCGQLNGFVMLDHADHPLQNAVIWLDRRAEAETRELAENFPEEFQRITGNLPDSIAVLPKLKWMVRHRPELIAKTHRIMLVKDYVLWRLTGNWITDATDGSATGMMDFDSRIWSNDLLKFCGISPDILPPIVPSAEIAGYITEQAATATGLETGLPVVPGAGDVGSLSVGCRVYDEGVLAITLGTAGHVVLSSRNAPLDDDHGVWRISHITEDREIWLGLIMSGGLSLVWMRNILVALTDGEPDFDEIVALTRSVPLGARGVTFLPFLEGAATPWSAPDARAVFYGLTSSHGAGEMVQAVMEGVAFNIRDCVEAFGELGGKITRIRIAEGGARSEKWCQIIADILQRPLELVKQNDTSASGAAILAMHATTSHGNFDETIVSMVQIEKIYYPRPGQGETVDALYQRYKELATLITTNPV